MGKNTRIEEKKTFLHNYTCSGLLQQSEVKKSLSVFERLSECCKKKTATSLKGDLAHRCTPASRENRSETCSLHYWKFLLIGVKKPATLFSFSCGQRPRKREKFIIN